MQSSREPGVIIDPAVDAGFGWDFCQRSQLIIHLARRLRKTRGI